MQPGSSLHDTSTSQALSTQSANTASLWSDSMLGEAAKLAVALAVAVVIAIVLFHSF